MIHTAVLKKEVLEYLDPQQNENFVDCTVGEGGHSEDILKKTGPAGKILGIDLDPQQIISSHCSVTCNSCRYHIWQYYQLFSTVPSTYRESVWWTSRAYSQ